MCVCWGVIEYGYITRNKWITSSEWIQIACVRVRQTKQGIL